MPQNWIDRCKVNDGANAMAADAVNGYEPRRRRSTTAVFGAALIALAVGANASVARAGSDDVQDDSLSDKILKTFGLRDPNDVQYEINYSERSPLVVPPTKDLPPPLMSGAKPVPNWPKDPDLVRRQAAKEDEKPQIRPFDSVMESSRPLRPNELNVGRVTPAVAAPGTNEQSTPSQLGERKSNFLSFDWMKKEQYATFTGEPARASLTDPPPGYLTPSPDQPYGISPEKKPIKPSTLGERMEPVR